MNIYELLTRFWLESEEQSFSPSEAALYSFLIIKANQRRWQMPFRCSTTAVCSHINTTRQNVVKARIGLKERGLIDFEAGTGKDDAPQYTILQGNRQLSGQLSDELPHSLSVQLSGQLPPYNIEDKDINHKNNAREKDLKGIDELKEILSKDEAWQMSVVNAIGSAKVRTPEDISSQLSQFFLMLEAQGVKQREERDCRAYFFNWLNKRVNSNNSNYGNKQQANILAQRRGVEVSVGAEKNYEGRF